METTSTVDATDFAPALLAAAVRACEVFPFPTEMAPAPSGDAATPPPAMVIAADISGDSAGTVTLVMGFAVAMAFAGDGTSGPIDAVSTLTPGFQALAAELGSTVSDVRQLEPSTLSSVAAVADILPLHTDAGLAAALLFDVTLPAPVNVDGSVDLASAATRPAPKPAGPEVRADLGSGLDVLRSVEMEVTVELGRTRLTVAELLSLAPGQVVELDRAAGTPADLFVNGMLLARGEIVVVDEDYGLRVTEIVGRDPNLG